MTTTKRNRLMPFFLFLLLFSSFVQAGNYIIFNETFSKGVATTQQIAGKQCIYLGKRSVGVDVIYLNLSYINSTNYVTINGKKWWCFYGNYNDINHYLTGNSFSNSSTLPYYNTKPAIKQSDVAWASSPSGQIMFMITNVTTPFTLGTDYNTKVRFSCGNVATMGPLVFVEKTGFINLWWNLDQSSQCTASGVNTNQCAYLGGSQYGFSSRCDGTGNFDNLNWTGNEIAVATENLTNWNGEVQYIGFSNFGYDNFYFDDLFVKAFNGTNQLPDFNVTSNGYTCVLENQTFPYTVPINFTVYDNEGDTIYYGQSQQKINETRYEDFIDYGWFKNDPDYSYLNNNYLSTCGFNLYTLDGNDHFLKSNQDSVGDMIYSLELNGYCSETDKSVYHVLPYASMGLNYEREILDMDDGELLNITFSDVQSKSNYLNKFLINKTGGKVYFSLLNNGTKTNLFNITTTEDYFRFKVINSYSFPENYYFKVTYSTNGLSLTDTKEKYLNLTSNPVRYVNYDLKPDTRIDLGYVEYTLVFFSVTFDNQKPNNVTFKQQGNKHMYYFVSDSVHQPTEYVKKDLWLRVEKKQSCYNSSTDTITDGLIGDNLVNLIESLNLKKEFITMLWWLYFLATAWFTWFIFNAGLMKQIKIPLASLLSSFICFVISYVIKDAGSMISFMIIFVLSCIFTVMQQ